MDDGSRSAAAIDALGAVYLARHGATRANERGVRIGLSPEPLSPRGRAQARLLAERVAPLDVRVIWTSPLVRARQTAAVVSARCRLPVRVCEALREMDYGPMEGLSEDQIARRFPDEKRAWSGEPRSSVAGAEPLVAVQRRVVDAIERIRGTHVALCVTHLTALRSAWAHYGARSMAEAAHFLPGHGELYRLDSAAGLERAA